MKYERLVAFLVLGAVLLADIGAGSTTPMEDTTTQDGVTEGATAGQTRMEGTGVTTGDDVTVAPTVPDNSASQVTFGFTSVLALVTAKVLIG